MTKGQIIIGVAIGAAIVFQGIVIHKLMGSINDKEKTIVRLENQVKITESTIVANEETLIQLMDEKSKLLEENRKMDDVLTSLLEKPVNKEWGCEKLPQDMVDFISQNFNLECKVK